MPIKISVDGKNYFYKTTKKRLNAFLSVLATQPLDDNYKLVNIKNDALLTALNIEFKNERGYREILQFDYEFIELTKEGKYNSLDNTRTCDRFEINFYNLCNFLTALAKCRKTFIKLRAIEMLGKRDNLPEEIKDYFKNYKQNSEYCLKEFNDGRHYKIATETEDNDDKDDYDGAPVLDCHDEKKSPVKSGNRYKW